VEPSTGEGEFNIVHNICCDADGWVYVADRENHRVQVFDGNGKFETQWQNLHRPCGLCMPYGHRPIFYVGEVGPAAAISRDIPNLGPRVSIVDDQGKLIGRFGDTPAGTELGKFLAPHGLAVDSRGEIYVGEVSWTAWPQIYPGRPHPPNLRSLQKFERSSDPSTWSMAVGPFSVQCSPGDVPTTCVVGSLRKIPTRQYQAAARKKPCKGNVPRGLVEGFKLFVPSRRHAAIAFRALLRARRALIAPSSSNGPLHSSVNHGVGRLCELRDDGISGEV
jgi:hypothetical protein